VKHAVTLVLPLLLASSPALAGKKDKQEEPPAADAPAADAPAADAPEIPAAAAAAYNYRKQVLSSLGKHMKALSFFVKGKLEPRTEDLVAHAQALQATSTVVGQLFPAGTGPDVIPDTEALPEIWEDPDGFAQRAQALVDASAALAEVAPQGDLAAFTDAYKQVGASCGGCHDHYRLDAD